MRASIRVAITVMVVALVASACGGTSTTGGATASASAASKPSVKVGSTNFYEQGILGELYAQILENSGYKVERKFNLGNREIVQPALESGQIDIDAEYLATLLVFLDKTAKASTDPKETAKTLQTVLSTKKLTVLDAAAATDQNGFVVTKDTAAKLNLKKLSDLAAVGGQLVLGGPAECPNRPFCQQGLKGTYGITFNYHIHTHDYYSLPLIPVVAISLALVGDRFIGWLATAWGERRGQLFAFAAIALVCIAGAAVALKKIGLKHASPEMKAQLKNVGAVVGFDKKALTFVRRSGKEVRAKVEAYKKIGELTGHSTKTIFLDEDYGKSLMYYGELSGAAWPSSSSIRGSRRTGRPMMESADDFAKLVGEKSAEFFIVTTPKDLDEQPAIKEYAAAHYAVVEQNERFAVFRIPTK